MPEIKLQCTSEIVVLYQDQSYVDACW